MDHFHVMLQKDGALVSTRRGMQVSKTKYHGISFVNASCPVPSSTGNSTGKSGKDSTKSNSSSSSSGGGQAKGPQVHTFSAFTPAATPAADSHASHDTATAKQLSHRWKFVSKPAVAAGAQTKNSKDSSRRRSSPAVSETSTTASTPCSDPQLSAAVSPAVSPTWSSPRTADTPYSGSAASPDARSPGVASDGSQQRQSPGAVVAVAPVTTHNRMVRSAAAKRNRKSRTKSMCGSGGGGSGSDNASLALALRSQSIARSLPTWTTCRIPTLSDAEQRMFHQVFQLVPRKIYPFEDLLQFNPSRSTEFYWMVAQDRAAVRCVMMCGAMFRAVLSGKADSQDLAHEVATVCGIVNDQLAHYQERSGSSNKSSSSALVRRRQPVPTMTLECITTLALMGGFTGRYDHWHVHMSGLKQLVAMASGSDLDGDGDMDSDINRLRPSLLTKMRKTDLKGAIALAALPYLPFSRTYPNVSDVVLPAAERAALAGRVCALLAPSCDAGLGLGLGLSLDSIDCGIGVRPVVVDALVQLCVFVAAVQRATARAATADPLPLDPYSFAEELHWVQYVLVSRPGALRDHATAAETVLPVDASRLHTEDIVRNHQAPLTGDIVPAALDDDNSRGTFGTASFLEPALRICGLLYLKEFLPDFPRNLGGYAVLLSLLRCHLGGGHGHGHGMASAGLWGGLELANGHSRAVLLWLCLVGDVVSRIADANEERRPADRYDRRVFHDRLVELVRSGGGSSSSSNPFSHSASALDVDNLPPSDWTLCRLLDIRSIQPAWDDRAGLLRILAEQYE